MLEFGSVATRPLFWHFVVWLKVLWYVLAVTSVAGNQTLDKTTLNARRILTIGRIRDVPIAAGMARPLVRELHTAPNIHGESGLDGYDFPPPEVDVVQEHAVDLIVRTVGQSPEPITLVPIGPLTNIALAFLRAPEITKNISRIVLMGGAEIRTGAWMVRGTIVALKPVRLLPTFSFACTYNPVFLRLYARHLQPLGFSVPVEEPDGAYRRYTGDSSVPGKGEILVWQPSGAN